MKVVLLVLAERTNKEGVCFPDMDLISAEASLSRSTVIRAINGLAGVGALARESRYDKRGKRTSNIYRLAVGTKCQIDTKTKCQPRQVLSVNEHATKCQPGGDHYIEATRKPQEERKEVSSSLLAKSAKPTPAKPTTPASQPPAKTYAWKGAVIRLTQADYDRWRKTYTFLAGEFDAELERADDYYAGRADGARSWFHRVSIWLAKANEEARREDWANYSSVEWDGKERWYAQHAAARELAAGIGIREAA